MSGMSGPCIKLRQVSHVQQDNNNLLLAVVDPGFSRGRTPTFKVEAPTYSYYLANFFPENYMKVKEIGPRGRARVSGAPIRSANDWRLVSSIMLKKSNEA